MKSVLYPSACFLYVYFLLVHMSFVPLYSLHIYRIWEWYEYEVNILLTSFRLFTNERKKWWNAWNKRNERTKYERNDCSRKILMMNAWSCWHLTYFLLIVRPLSLFPFVSLSFYFTRSFRHSFYSTLHSFTGPFVR